MPIQIDVLVYGIAYAAFSSTLLVANKWALTFRNTPNALVVYQSFATWIFMLAVIACERFRISPLWGTGTPFKTRNVLLWFIFATVLQSLTIGANLNALYHLGVDRVILLRVCAMIPIAFGDWLFNNRALPSAASWVCFATLGMAASFVFGTDHSGLTFTGFVWGILYLVLITTDQVALKRFTQAVPMQNVDRTHWMNAFGALASFTLAQIYSEPVFTVSDLSGQYLPHVGYVAIGISCFLAAGISFSAWGLRDRSSALTFSLIGLICKIGSMVLNFLMLDHLSVVSLIIISLGIASTWFYEQAPELKQKVVSDTESNVLASDVPIQEKSRSVNCPFDVSKIRKEAVIIFILVLFIGTLNNQQNSIFDYGHRNNDELEWKGQSHNFHPSLPFENRTYSSNQCVGLTHGADFWRFRSCYLKAVCYDGNPQGSLTYYAHPSDDVTAQDLSTSTMVPYGSDVRAPAREYKVNLSYSAVPSNVEWPYRNLKPGERTPVVAPVDFFIPAVWTHLVADNILPLFKLLEIFDLPHDSVDLLPHSLSDPCPPNGYRDGCGTSDPRYNSRWIRLVNGNKWDYIPIQTAYQNRTAPIVCFDHVVYGLSVFSDHGVGWSGHGRNLNEPVWTNWGISSTMWSFRGYTMKRAREISLAANETDYTGPFYDILFTLKGKSSFANNRLNTSLIFDRLAQKISVLPAFANLTIGYPIYLEQYSLLHQMELVAKCKVLISQVGSTAYGSLWLPKGATLILLHQDEMLDYFLWNNLAWLRAVYQRYDQPPQPGQVEKIARAAVAGAFRAIEM